VEGNLLHGIRVADFTWAWAGPYGTMLLALMGAEVIKIESSSRLDHTRVRSLAAGPTFGGPDHAWIFNELNLNKLSITLDLGQPKAVQLAKRLVKVSDVAVQNFRAGVMDRLGLGYSSLMEVKPDIIMLSSSAVGGTGPERQYVGFAPTFSALGGLAHITGFPDSPPIPVMGSADLRSATTAAFALLAAIYHRTVTGEGQHIDLSSREAITALVGESILEYAMNQRSPSRQGNRDEAMAPHNCYPCLGENKWVSIAVATEEEWQALRLAMGNPRWAEEERFSDTYARWHNQEELDRLIAEWTINYTHYEVMARLQKVNVAAVPSFRGDELFNDPHLKERGFSVIVEHPLMGTRTVTGPPWKLSSTPAKVSRHGPLLGEHNHYVFSELLGLSEKEVKKLVAEKVIY
jgi:crotonobetainyl-CoA:carnitine CoA-transferase CaiB-like acyl-CoA transferase